ncbi:carbamate kinase [Pseudonocardia asaccharolytica]|uniref:Carbamate kinase n=1 Tax=Pseudonocardia asaccharolytica DSM 44247 = NBRC 16224 TaxID=1123024 RepID=A0A511D8Z7_9PSEU|nr:carbamate kinase [Pseudonocardia asaccharolytica]GEL20873.1 carbamate kinase [Pseudonocardia asaccharolytica DSM 44247 = NBRC 16224]
MAKTVVVALGGNAIIRSGQAGTHAEQVENARAMAVAVCRMREAGWTVVLVHGNGPQVGNLAIQQEEAAHRVPELPLYWLGAMTEGHLGCLLTLALHDAGHGRLSGVVPIITHTVVDEADPAFSRPTKPIGPFFEEPQARRYATERGWTVGEDAGRGYRRLVASPRPRRFVEIDAVRALVERGMIVVAAGGGGIPVVAEGDGYRGVEAVIDKDLAAQALATALCADALVLVTDVPQVMLDYGTPQARPIVEMSVDEAQRHADEHQFPEGSMGPKIHAAIRFVRGSGRTAVITNAERACASVDVPRGVTPGPQAGTRIVAARGHEGAAS